MDDAYSATDGRLKPPHLSTAKANAVRLMRANWVPHTISLLVVLTANVKVHSCFCLTNKGKLVALLLHVKKIDHDGNKNGEMF